MNLAQAFAATVTACPEKTALFWGETEFSYAQIDHAAHHLAQQLTHDFQVCPGDRVGIWLKNGPEFIPALFGILNTGAVVVPINSFFKPAEAGYVLADAGIRVLISRPDFQPYLAALQAEHPQLRLLLVTETTLAPPPTPRVRFAIAPRAASELAVLIYTSGTTGRPKGAMLSHRNLLHNVASSRIALDTRATDRYAVILPLFHIYMLTVGVLLPLLNGAAILLIKSLSHPQHMLREMIQRQATTLPAIPQFYRTLAHLNLPVQLPFRLCISGAAPLPAQILRDFETKHGIPIMEGYGLSEASPEVTKNPFHGVRKPGSIGLPIPNVELSIQDEAGQHLGPNQTGEICVRGANVMLGYWQQPEETAKVMRGEWLLTGDLGHRDADGYYFVTDRKKDMLIVNGINVYPREIEEVLYQYPGVKEAAVIGIPDARRGEQPLGFVVTNEDQSLDERHLLQFLRQNLADYKVPRQIRFLPSLPRTASGKIRKPELRELVQPAADAPREPNAAS